MWRYCHHMVIMMTSNINPDKLQVTIMKFRVLVLFIFVGILCSSCSVTVKPTENEQALIESIQEILSVKKQLAETYWCKKQIFLQQFSEI